MIGIVETIEGELRVSSLTIAERTERDHEPVIRLIRDNLADFEAFGRVRFENGPFETRGGIQSRTVAHLNEPQATLLVTFMRNSDIVKAFKLELVRQFYEMRQALARPAELSRADLARMVLESEAEREALAAKVSADAPKVEYVERHVDLEGDVLTFRDAAQHLGVKEGVLRESLRAGGWIYRVEAAREWSQSKQELVSRSEWRAKAGHASKFSLRAQHNAPRYHNGQVRQTLYVTAGGLEPIRRKLIALAVVDPVARALAAVDENGRLMRGAVA